MLDSLILGVFGKPGAFSRVGGRVALQKKPQGQRVEVGPNLSASAPIHAVVLACGTYGWDRRPQAGTSSPIQGVPGVPAPTQAVCAGSSLLPSETFALI